MINKLSFSRIVFNIINYTLMALFCFICIMPLWHVLMASISDPKSLIVTKGLLFTPAGEVNFGAYKIILKNHDLIKGYMNTFMYVGLTTLITTISTVIAGYVISRDNMKLKMPIIAFMIFPMLFGGGLIPTYMIIRSLGMINHASAIIIPGVINTFFIIIVKSAFDQLPKSYEESAMLDGADPLVIMFKILLPLIKSTIAVIIMFNIIGQWNSWYPASIYLPQRRDLWPLQLFMREILVQNDTAKILTGSDVAKKADFTTNLVKYAVAVVGTFPLLVLYPFVQKHFVKGVQMGGVKG